MKTPDEQFRGRSREEALAVSRSRHRDLGLDFPVTWVW